MFGNYDFYFSLKFMKVKELQRLIDKIPILIYICDSLMLVTNIKCT